ncbi:hypothetical protein ABID65_007540 [Bradyrhizobium sp. S3.9.2]|uniref:IPT/TIG domain-containing protein n=1 Tax=Bradyrhizobium sp. S3.9.2 TaxID=3156432 RepID=UPI0033940FEB
MIPAQLLATYKPSYFVPTVASVSPTAGATTGGAAITITGTNFKGVTAVTIGGTSVSFSVVNSTTITASAPAHAAGAVDVSVTNPAGTGTLTNAFTYYAAPTVTSVAPNVGGTAGGTGITITGTNFTGATSVVVGGTAVAFTLVNSTTITANTPAHAAGAGDVSVTNPGGTGTLTNAFTFYAAPTVTSVSPNSGTAAGGTAITITGTNFTGATSVAIGGTAVAFTLVNSTTITASTPAHATGAVSVTVTNPGGTGTGTNVFTYQPAITPGSQQFDSGSGAFVVPTYQTLTVEVWGGGGCGIANNPPAVAGNSGSASSVSTLGMTANGGVGDTGILAGATYTGQGGTASGGNNANTQGNQGGHGTSQAAPGNGFGAGAPNGGGNVAAPGATASGITGSAPGGGGTGLRINTTIGSGGSSGGYCKSVYTAGVTPGAPGVGASLSYAVGAGGPASGGTQKNGAGANGRVKFTWS